MNLFIDRAKKDEIACGVQNFREIKAGSDNTRQTSRPQKDPILPQGMVYRWRLTGITIKKQKFGFDLIFIPVNHK